ncbi:hypothetical protein [Streptacidiphilus neutrinimicus]|uniref:hypothetical protein n=1 Tax=Streptacidiphilus neutrinimicus TaxID=105420 RepID=UPI0005A95CA7|nr:hypothetical protein [Streptacidiphilus neutrinimicus]
MFDAPTAPVLWLTAAAIGRELHSAALDEFRRSRHTGLFQYTGVFVTGIALYLMHRFGADLLLWLLPGFAWLPPAVGSGSSAAIRNCLYCQNSPVHKPGGCAQEHLAEVGS